MTFFRLLWGFDALICLVVVYYFISGIVDGSISSFNIALWVFILLALAVVMSGSFFLNHHHHSIMAKALLSVVAFPGLLLLIYAAVMLLVKPDMK